MNCSLGLKRRQNQDHHAEQRHPDRDPEVEDELELTVQLEAQVHVRSAGRDGFGHARIIEGALRLKGFEVTVASAARLTGR